MMSKTITRHGALALPLLLCACATETQRLELTTRTGPHVYTAPPAEEAATRNMVLVRFVHAAEDTGSMDVHATDLTLFQGVEPHSVTAFREVPTGEYVFRVREAGDQMGEALNEGVELSIDEGNHYTVVAIRGEDEAKTKLLIYEDDLNQPEPNTASVRVINASRTVGPVDVYTPGWEEALFGDVEYGEVTEYEPIKPLTGSLNVHRVGETTVLESFLVDIDEGVNHTLVLTGGSTGESEVGTILIEDYFGTRVAMR